MKKIYSLLSVIVLSATAATAQENLVLNPGFEEWANEQPVSYAPYSTYLNINLVQENNIKHSGNSSARHQSQSSTQNVQQDDLIPVIAGNSYTISYWYLDNDPAAKTRIWSAWMQAGTPFTQLSDDEGTLRYADNDLSFSTDNPQWINKTLTLTAPANATHFRFQVRTNREAVGADGGYIYYDDFSFVDNTAAGVKQNEIAGLTVSPNPLTGNVLTVKSNSNAAKGVAIFDITGKQVLNTTTANNTVNTNNLTAGVYIVKVTEDGKTATKKLIVQ
ncbi:T9SS type A sorting domain-containing protein [Flavobacterium sp. Sd200]|uniref:T9SS type A sorting domain-containing protein n=1 Tax=Flavobacterium sp. Sd200 TaxID=2692211 RepID=UPI0013679EFB|nr:T9SS type A sorting domain-containing protein [Flavobacterium sp. Sd200]MXN92146.1 T9SS type A sorting domain-containing protein [Flavobacterium sp. Sd200]